MVTVGQSRAADGCPDFDRDDDDVHRSMSTAIENGAIQRAAGGKEQGSDEDIWQVLSVGVACYVAYRMCVVLLTMMFILCRASE